MADTFLYYKAIIYKDGVHRPLATDERLTSDSIPVSQMANNGIRVVPDGLYVGGLSAQSAYYVASSGVDAPDSGTKAKPFKTLQYALDTLISTYDLGNPIDPTAAKNILGSITVALKAGETFPINKTYEVFGAITLTFWGDPTYGDFDAPLIGSPGTRVGFMADLQRPKITPGVENATANGVYHFQLHEGSGAPATMELYGVRVDLPSFAGVSDSDYCSFCNVAYGESGRLRIMGSVINRTDTASSYGIFGIHSRAHGAILEEYASQFLIQGNQIQPVPSGFQPTADQLSARKWFIIFYPDLKGNNQAGGQLMSGPAPTGLLKLLWSEVPSAPVLPGKSTLGTYPVMADPSYGIANYFFNLTRDNQGRPLNVTSAQLF